MNLYKAILKQYGKDVSGGIGSFSEMGFTMGEIAGARARVDQGFVHRPERQRRVPGREELRHRDAVPAVDVRRYPLHIPNNQDYTVTPSNGKMVLKQGCTNISSVDPQIAQYRSAAGTAATAPGQPAG